MKKVIEKYFDLTEPYIDYDINKYLLNGWFIVHTGLTLVIMQKYI